MSRTLRRQSGVIHRDQVLAAGLSEDAIDRALAERAWHRVGPQVYQSADHDETPRSRHHAAVLSAGDGAVLVGRSAAWWWRLAPTAPATVELAVAPPRRPRSRPGVAVARRRIDPADRTVVAGLLVTKRAPTVLDAAVGLGLEDGARLMDHSLLTGAVGLDRLREVHTRTAGRPGTVIGRELLALAAGGARSEAERVAHRELRAGGVTGWAANVEIALPGFGVAVGDLVFAAEKVVVEVDGWAFHRDLRAFLRDGPRQSALAAAGWTVLRTHWFELRESPAAFVGRVRTTLTRRSPR